MARKPNTQVGAFISPITVNSVQQGTVAQPNVNTARKR